MARPVQIDRKRALKAARELFWRQGYTATSMNQLLEATGMGAGSFYAAFGNKSRLFELAADHYADWSEAQFSGTRRDHAGLDALRMFLEKTLVDVSDVARRKGCLLVNSALELEGVEPQLHDVVSAHLAAFAASIRSCLEDAAEREELRAGISVTDAAALMMTLIHGLRVESRLGLNRADAGNRVNTMIHLVARETTPCK